MTRAKQLPKYRQSPGARWAQALLVLLALSLLASCEAVRHLERDDILIKNDPKFKGNKNLSSEVLAEGILTKANKRLLLPKLYLHFYNLGKSIEKDTSVLKRTYQRLDSSRYYERQFTGWLENIVGEPPALVSARQINADARNLESIYFGEGFLNAFVQPYVKRTKRDPQKADVIFEIDEGEEFVLREMRYYYRDPDQRLQGSELEDSLSRIDADALTVQRDSTVLRLLRETADQSLLQPGDRFKEATLTQERVRIANFMRDQGYYTFGPENVFYIVDTIRSQVYASDLVNLEARPDSATNRQTPDIGPIDTAAVGMDLRAAQQQLQENLVRENRGNVRETDSRRRIYAFKETEHPYDLEVIIPDTSQVFYIDSVFVTIRQAGETSSENSVIFNLLNPAAGKVYGVNQRTIQPDYDVNFRTNELLARTLNLGIIAKRIRQRPGVRYSRSEAILTQSQLQALGLFRNTVVTFRVVPGTNKLHANLDCVLLRNYTTSIGVESFLSDDRTLQSNLPGLGASFKLGIQNLFGRAEQLRFTSNGFISFFSPGDGEPVESFFQFSAQTQLVIPRFLLVEGFSKNSLLRFRPSTSFSLTYLQEQRDIFRRTNLTGSWQYQWYNKPNSIRAQTTLTPLSITFVRSIEEAGFEEEIAQVDTSLRALILRDFEDRLATKTSYVFRYSADYGQLRYKNTWFFRGTAEVGGNLPYLIDVLGGTDGTTEDNVVGGRFQYGQFVRFSAEGRYNIPLGLESDLVFRLFAGAAVPYGSTPVIPFENRFFSGGANSVRGWLAGTLGPGTFRSDTVRINNLIAPGGEYIFEVNAEYRTKLTDILQLALFADAGNVWFSRRSTENEDGFQDPSAALTKENLQLGVAAGVGLRFDLSFFIFRFDIGQQIYAPDVQGFVTRSLKDLGAGRAQFNIGIGYPF